VNPDLLDFVTIPLTTVMDNAQLEANCAGIEQVTLLGYPYGLFDDVNYLPLARRGSTAMPPWVDWKGKAEFLVDIAGFQGNSGGPLLLFNHGNYTSKSGTVMGGKSRLALLGVFSAVYNSAEIPLSLGLCIKGTVIRDMVHALTHDRATS